MNSEYDRKFEEMKKYIPFLENMIRRLETTSSPSANPRQAQLDKIRSLRDLLLDEKKRMKMENLLKCEQVLVNLYAKVEQRDSLPSIQTSTEQYPTVPIKSNVNNSLENVRSRLKTVPKKQEEIVETLPEIARASEIEEICTPGSKEPALFQRRPNRPSKSPRLLSPINLIEPHVISPQQSVNKRNYTRVLLSPEPRMRRWTPAKESTSENYLFNRKSPPNAQPCYSSINNKKEKKQSSKQAEQSNKPNDLNITLKVPEESLNSLNTTDILSRIINCSDNDVDIRTLRVLRTQILGELKQTGANDDISDLILKSYKNKKSVNKQTKEVEEGELSDSESEAIESIYGSLVVVDKDKDTTEQSLSSIEQTDQPRKIQICLVINSKDADTNQDVARKTPDISVLETCSEQEKKTKELDAENEKNSQINNKTEVVTKIKVNEISAEKQCNVQDVITIEDDDDTLIDKNSDRSINMNKPLEKRNQPKNKYDKDNCGINNEKANIITNEDKESDKSGEIFNKSDETLKKSTFDEVSENISTLNTEQPIEVVPFRANFYKPLIEEDSIAACNMDMSKSSDKSPENKTDSIPAQNNEKDTTAVPATSTKSYHDRDNISKEFANEEKFVEIPLLNEPTVLMTSTEKDVVSEIDILQALKNEILSENIPIPGSEIVTPPLHQPKLIKVSSAKEIMQKRKISIEKYKERSVPSPTTQLFMKKRYISISQEDQNKKQSLKLTEKECERFNFPAKIPLDDDLSSDNDEREESTMLVADTFEDFAPRSPDNEYADDLETTLPVIIPADPIKTTEVKFKVDIDMRTMLPMASPNNSTVMKNITTAVTSASEKQNESYKNDTKQDKNKVALVDPRVRSDLLHFFNKNSPNPERTPRSLPYTTVPPSNHPHKAPSMTPNARTYDMTPTHEPFDLDDYNSKNKHVYATSFPLFEGREVREKSVNNGSRPWDSDSNAGGRRSRWNENKDTNSRRWDDSDSRSNSSTSDLNSQKSNYSEPLKYDKFYAGSKIERFKIDRRSEYSKSDCPQTPVPSFGWSDNPNKTNLFGRMDMPTTPVHNFGRSDCPSTPTHSFGRLECAQTPSHPFRRSECPLTPSHSFGRSECPPTPCHSLGRNDFKLSPSHPFRRSDGSMTPNHAFGRTDYPQNNSQKYTKDPRLKRTTDYVASSRYDERDREFYREGGFNPGKSYKPPSKPYGSSSDSYRSYDREQSVGKSDKNRYCSNEHIGRNFNKDLILQRESSVACVMSRERDGERLYTRERSRRFEYDDVPYEETGLRQGYQRERSVGRSVPQENFPRSTTRAPSIGRNSRIETDTDNTLSIKSPAGRSFTIDTSVNATFQDLIERKGLQIFDYTVDAHRKRASSVGRSLGRESSVGRTLSSTSKRPNPNERSQRQNKKTDFRRASSMGRDLVDSKMGKTFHEIKADLVDYKNKTDLKVKNMHTTSHKKNDDKSQTYISNKSLERNIRSKKDIYESQHDKKSRKSDVKQPYSPKKNCRDPRLRNQKPFEAKYKKYSFSRDPRDKRNYGIVYSSDNIAKGDILGPGYGVKNYKIPKIKRVTENTEEIDIELVENMKKEEKMRDKKFETKKEIDQGMASDGKDKKKQIDEANLTIDVEIIKKRPTRSSKKNYSEESNPDDDIVLKKKTNKPLIYDSESDNECASTKEEIEDKILSDETISPRTESQHVEIIELHKEEPDANFGLDDLGIFSDNIVSDPVIDNINALIADLDNDIDTSKNDDPGTFTDEMTLENMLESITSPDNIKCFETESLNDTGRVIKSDSNKNDDQQTITKAATTHEENNTHDTKPIEIVQPEADDSCNILDTSREPTNVVNSKPPNIEMDKVIQPKILDDEVCEINKIVTSDRLSKKDVSNINNEAIVSTSDVDKDISEKLKVNLDDKSNDGCSTPDSTNNTHEVALEISNDGVADSTNEVQNDINSDVTSTHNATDILTKEIVESSSSRKDTIPTMDSIGSLLSILQDKSKIKELLNMLGDQSSNNDKIKKKLEKLSEIVSDEEDITIDDVVQGEATENSYKKEILIKSEKQQSAIDKTVIEPELETINDTPCTLADDLSEQDTITHDSTEHVDNVEQDRTVKSVDLEKPDHGSNAEQTTEIQKPKKKAPNKKTRKGRFSKINKNKSVTRASGLSTPIVKSAAAKKPSRELKKLQDDIKEMFMNDKILNATGIRMCRLAKLVDDKNINQKEIMLPQESKPVVILEKFKDKGYVNEIFTEKPARKKPGLKLKNKATIKDKSIEDLNISDKKFTTAKNKPGPKSKTKGTQKHEDLDPYVFESDSVDTNALKESEDESENSSESESDSLTSSKSFDSNEVLAGLKKKPKRKRRGKGWQTGVIKPKHKKKKDEMKNVQPLDEEFLIPDRDIVIPDLGCFTDKLYCFQKNMVTYSCRLCVYSGKDIVHHYKKQHPHVEIPLSRMNPDTAREAIEQCREINFQAISKIPTDKYVCRFCFKEFGKSKAVLEAFFWHVVSTHTGEYKQICSECVTATRCPYNLDIPPPPKDIKGQLIGYICKKCNFTQISLENLKTHVIVRHNDEQTEVYTINLAAMTKKSLKALTRRCDTAAEIPRILRSSRSNQSVTEASDDRSDITDNSSRISESESARQSKDDESLSEFQTPDKDINPTKSKITFEADENVNHVSNVAVGKNTNIKIESDNVLDNEDQSSHFDDDIEPETLRIEEDNTSAPQKETEHPNVVSDIIVCAHFKISYKESGTKEYICCINGNDNHYKTTLLISMKKHVQMKHSETWDGYCIMCKVIVTTQGVHHFKDCLQHFLDKHMGDFPVLEKEADESQDIIPAASDFRPEETSSPTSYINVRPLAQLISPNDSTITTESTPHSLPEVSFPKIENVVSLGTPTVEPPRPSPNYPMLNKNETHIEIPVKYEEWQADVMSKKHRVVLDTMMSRDKLIKVYKCAGRFCSFTSDNAEGALLHASTHQRIGGENALNCAYCDFDAARNAIDLVMHVFKTHGCCQFACALCFYRAAASQLVAAHIKNVHPGASVMGSVLRTTSVSTTGVQYVNILTREDAVPYYVCGHITTEGDIEGTCKFKTYTVEKFSEHLLQRHEAPHPCNICSMNASNATDLIQHLKTHGFKVYQCTWCVFGADTESELLLHAATKHPTKQPQAYMRIITRKGGSTELRVLPLACLNRSKIPTEDVTPASPDDAVREAERSIELEKLIGHIESTVSIGVEAGEPVETELDVTTSDTQNINDETPLSESDAQESVGNDVESPPSNPSRAVTPKDTNQIMPVIKTESPEQTDANLSSDVIHCLDSDDDESRPNVIDLSDDGPTTRSSSKQRHPDTDKYAKLSLMHLYKCPKCRSTFRTLGGFKKHMFSCCPNSEFQKVVCPHRPCNKELNSKEDLIEHYLKDHRMETSPVYVCGVCDLELASLPLVKSHIKQVHRVTRVVVASKLGNKSNFIYTAREAEKPGPKRKLSATQLRRYGPEDIERLPINPILDSLVHCSLCEFSTKVRLNMVRHLLLHARQQPVPKTAPVNPVPHLESNEKHFDKMLNLASSSNVTRAPERPLRPETSPVISSTIHPEAASRYPKYVAERHRYTCGAKGCSYISLDEAMLKCHWETLHSNTNDYHCVHCPPYQHLDTTKPLSAVRIVAHLKMHDVTLYACSSCMYYHFKREMVEKHLAELHQGGQVMVVREEASTTTPVTVQSPSAPTMDLKPWQCGLCKFKSMLRPEVAEHCSKIHQSKMQFKCAYCPFRTSVVENVTKHQLNSHPGNNADVFYYYYREGSIPDEADGTPRWLKQRQRSGVTEVKTEVPDASVQNLPPMTSTSSAAPPVAVDLNIVKTEVNEESDMGTEECIESLCRKFGEFCDPNGIKYKCALCSVVAEDTREAMQSHLYEELKYRKWGCNLCSYKAFHKTGLNDHISSEHRRQYQEPVALTTDVNIEKWVTMYLDHQAGIIDKNKDNLIQQKILVSRVTAGPSKVTTQEPAQPESTQNYTVLQLEQAFGSFGTASGTNYCCPKCDFKVKDEGAMREHMETELSKIRWCCSTCTSHFQSYHEAQFHCRSAHVGLPSRPQGSARDPAMRARWLTTLLHTQQQTMDTTTINEPTTPNKMSTETEPNENSLLMVRYVENVPTLEEPVQRKRPAQDSDDERLVIVETQGKRKSRGKNCPYCEYKSKWSNVLRDHLLRHYNLKPYLCEICKFSGFRSTVVNHLERCHPGQKCRILPMPIPDKPPELYKLPIQKTKKLTQEESNRVICLHCEKYVHENETDIHKHDNVTYGPEFARKGEVVVKCCICLMLRLDVKSLQEHHNACHPDKPINYAFFKLHCDTKDSHYCGHCNNRFRYLRDFKSHHNAVHNTLPYKYTINSTMPATDEETEGSFKRRNNDCSMLPSAKKVARKSTTKLPKTCAVAKKSTTKLPGHCVDSDSESEADKVFSYYGTNPPHVDEYANVITLMPFCNTLRPFTVKTLRELMEIDPKVVVKDINK